MMILFFWRRAEGLLSDRMKDWLNWSISTQAVRPEKNREITPLPSYSAELLLLHNNVGKIVCVSANLWDLLWVIGIIIYSGRLRRLFLTTIWEQSTFARRWRLDCTIYQKMSIGPYCVCYCSFLSPFFLQWVMESAGNPVYIFGGSYPTTSDEGAERRVSHYNTGTSQKFIYLFQVTLNLAWSSVEAFFMVLCCNHIFPITGTWSL